MEVHDWLADPPPHPRLVRHTVVGARKYPRSVRVDYLLYTSFDEDTEEIDCCLDIPGVRGYTTSEGAKRIDWSMSAAPVAMVRVE